MVWEHQVTTIVMLTCCIENSKVCPPNKNLYLYLNVYCMFSKTTCIQYFVDIAKHFSAMINLGEVCPVLARPTSWYYQPWIKILCHSNCSPTIC